MTTKSEYWANGYDDGYAGYPLLVEELYAPGTAAYNDYCAGYEDGATDSWHDGEEEFEDPESDDDGLTDAEADAMTLAGAGWGTDEDYGYYGDQE